LKTGVYGPLNEKQTNAVERIEKNERDLLAIINEVLGFVDADKQPAAMESEDVRIAGAFDTVTPLIASPIERKQLVLERALSDPALAVRADPKALEQILASLLSNAVKYTGEGGTITLGADRDGDKARIWIRDTGIGISRDELQRVFEPFFQADGSTTRLYSGIGLGLTIARDLARRMNGEVIIASEAGSGTTATVVLPAASSLPRAEVDTSEVVEVAPRIAKSA
jgi:signal transduction histidine kinase